MPKQYIDVDKVLSMAKGYNDLAVDDFAYELSQLPTADVAEVKRGKWVWLSSTHDRSPCEMRFWCSECHHRTIVHTNGTAYPWEHYCPNCGAKMD